MLRLLTFTVFCFLLTSCVSTKKRPNQTNAKPYNTQNWAIIGKFSLSNGQENGSGKISYSVKNKVINAKFKAPLGQGSWEIKDNKNHAELLSTKHNPIYGSDAQTLISNKLGWDFPWESLNYWLRAYKTHAKITAHNTVINSLEDNGWNISFSKWEETPAGLLPKKIKASKPPYSVKLIIYKWDIK